MSLQSVLVVSPPGRVAPHLSREPIAAKDLLLRHADSMYSGARTVGQRSVFNLDQHFVRLANVSPTPSWAATAEARRARCMPATRLAMHHFHEVNAPLMAAAGEFKLLFVETPDDTLYVSCLSMGSHPSEAIVEVRDAGARSDASRKHTGWVEQRQVFERAAAADVNEVLLASEDGLLYEGLQSNLFVVERDGTLVTADSSCTLLGTVQQVLLQHLVPLSAAAVRVERRCPRTADIASWRGAFLTSTSRLLLPIAEVRVMSALGDDPAAATPAAVHRLPSGDQLDPLVAELQSLLNKHVSDHATLVLD